MEKRHEKNQSRSVWIHHQRCFSCFLKMMLSICECVIDNMLRPHPQTRAPINWKIGAIARPTVHSNSILSFLMMMTVYRRKMARGPFIFLLSPFSVPLMDGTAGPHLTAAASYHAAPYGCFCLKSIFVEAQLSIGFSQTRERERKNVTSVVVVAISNSRQEYNCTLFSRIQERSQRVSHQSKRFEAAGCLEQLETDRGREASFYNFRFPFLKIIYYYYLLNAA